nr:hypothetical protein [uncultured Oscillibacter sp.]
MKVFSNRRIWLGGGLLAAALAFCAWIYGWGGGPIRLLDVPAEDVARIELSSSGRAAVVTESEELQVLMDTVNAFRHSGNEIKNHPALLFGAALGGTKLYEFRILFKSGEEFAFCFGLNKGGQDPADTEVAYWIPGRPSSRFGSTCRGSMERIDELLEEGRSVQW